MPKTEQPAAAVPADPHVVPSGSYVADPALSRLDFRAKAFGLMWVNGHMPATSGTLQVRDGRLSGTGEVAANKLSTGLRPRDWHLHTSHYLHATQHPTIQLSVEDADIASGHAEVRIVVRSNPATVRMELDSMQFSAGVLRLEAHGTIDRSPFRMLPPIFGVSRLVHVALTVVATPA